MKIFLVSGSYDPTYGGPAFSVSRLGLALAERGVEVFLWAPDGSAETSTVVIDHPLLRRCSKTLKQVLANVSPDVIHDNGIWMPHNHALSVLAKNKNIPRVVSIRGMLEPWAVNHKRVKKALAWRLYQRSDLRSASILHVTAQMESKHLEEFRLDVPVEMIPNGVEMPPETIDNRALGGDSKSEDKVALFMSRLHPKKGLPMLIEAWARVKPKGWRLVIAGPDEGGHRKEVERLVADRGLVREVLFSGPIEPCARSRLYDSVDLFVLPTHSENFGMVVGEALAHGVPVLTTKGAPWSLLEKEGCGWWVGVSVEEIIEGLRMATSCDRHKLESMGLLGRRIVEKEFSWESISNRFCNAYSRLIKTC